jgi:hypothetical protein
MQRIAFRQPDAVRDFTRAIGIPLYSYVPIPATNYHFWETSIFRTDFFTLPYQWVALSTTMFLSFLFCLRRSPFALSSYALGTLAVSAFSYLVLTGAMRHYGQVYILLVACLWIAYYCQSTRRAERSFKNEYPFNRATKLGGILFTSIVFVQACVGIFCYALDLQYPFSNDKAVADYLTRMNWQDRPICVRGINGVGICVLLDRSVYQFNDRRHGTFWQSRQAKRREYDFAYALEFSRKSRCIIITMKPKPAYVFGGLKIRFSKKFVGAIVPTQNRYLWIVSP